MHTHSPATKQTHHWHQVLGVNCTPTQEEIKAAYKQQAMIWHPDRHTGEAKKVATEKFVEITNAYKALVMTTRPGLQRRASQELFARNTGLMPKPGSPFPRPSSSRQSSRSTLSQSFSSEDLESEMSEDTSSSPPSSVCSSSDHSSEHHHKTSGYMISHSYIPGTIAAPHPQTSVTQQNDSTSSPHHAHTHLPDYGPPLSSVGVATSKEWKYSLSLPLEDLYHGKHLRLRITRYNLSGVRKNVVLDVDIPPGCQPGSRIYCRGAGHERKDGSFQDIVFLVDQAPHDKFSRVGNDLIMDVHIPWHDGLKRPGGKLCFTGINEEDITVRLEFSGNRQHGTCTIPGHGMPVRQGKAIVGRGDLIVRWEVTRSSHKKWDAFRTLMHLKK